MKYNFTAYNDERINRAILDDLHRVTRGLAEILGDRLISVMIAGGFGRGEGGVRLEGDRVRPVNDYDFYVVVKKLRQTRRQYGQRLNELAGRLAKELDIKQIDIGLVSRLQLLVPRCSVARYEAGKGRQVLFGKKIPVSSVPAVFIPSFEGARYFSNRGGGLLIARCILELQKDLPGAWRENFEIEMNKAAIAMGDALLLLQRNYHWSYAERRKRMQAVQESGIPRIAEIKAAYEKAVLEKLFPHGTTGSREDLNDQWNELNSLFIDTFVFFESKRLHKIFSGLTDYAGWVSRPSFNLKNKLYERLYRLVSGGRLRMDEDCRRAVILLLLDGWRNDEALIFAEKLLGVYPSGSGGSERWLAVTRILLMRWHPDGVVHDLLA